MTRPFKIGFAVILVALVLDQVSKVLALQLLNGVDRITVIPGFFDLSLAWNRGVSFSMFSSSSDFMPWVLSCIAIVIIFGLLCWLTRVTSLIVGCGLGLILGGAVGNLIDRIQFGAVLDFLDFYVATYHWPTFNIADCAVIVGVGLILLDSWITSRKTS